MRRVGADIIADLRREILAMQAWSKPAKAGPQDMGLGPMTDAFPQGCFPTGAIHEFLYSDATNKTATAGFIAGLLSSLLQPRGLAIWINAGGRLFPPALRSFGIDPSRIIFIDLPTARQTAWVMREALQYEGLSAVIAEMSSLDFMTSRRLQLAVEQSSVTGMVLRRTSSGVTTTAAVARWMIQSLPSEAADGLPGLGYPRWKVELLRIRNGRPGCWQMKWREGKFQPDENRLHRIPAIERKVV